MAFDKKSDWLTPEEEAEIVQRISPYIDYENHDPVYLNKVGRKLPKYIPAVYENFFKSNTTKSTLGLKFFIYNQYNGGYEE